MGPRPSLSIFLSASDRVWSQGRCISGAFLQVMVKCPHPSNVMDTDCSMLMGTDLALPARGGGGGLKDTPEAELGEAGDVTGVWEVWGSTAFTQPLLWSTTWASVGDPGVWIGSGGVQRHARGEGLGCSGQLGKLFVCIRLPDKLIRCRISFSCSS